MRSVLRGAGVVAAGVAVAVLVALSPRGGLVEPSTPPVPPDADAYVAERVARSQALGVWPQATERLVRHGEGKTDVAFLYIHGFGASRGEGEYVVDQLAADWSAGLDLVRAKCREKIDKEAKRLATTKEAKEKAQKAVDEQVAAFAAQVASLQQVSAALQAVALEAQAKFDEANSAAEQRHAEKMAAFDRRPGVTSETGGAFG